MRKTMRNIAIIFFALIACANATDDLPNDPKALHALVERGDHEAMTKLGYFYFTGNQVEKSVEKALSLYSRAAEKGNLGAMSNLCNMYLYGEGVEKNIPLAFQLCKEPARAGNPNSMVMLAEIVQSIEEGPLSQDRRLAEETAFKFYEMAAVRGHPHGQYMLGQFYERGKGTAADIKQAKEWYQKAATQGHEGAADVLGKLETHKK
jgi:TPR repeat protein